MKIAQIVSTFSPYTGGMGQAAYDLSLELTRRGYEVTVFTPRYLKNSKLIDSPLQIKYLKPLISYGNAAWVPQLAWQLSKFNIIHLHYPFFGGQEAVWLAKKLNPKLKLVITYQMDVFGGQGLKAIFFRFYQKYLTPLILKSADAVTVSTRDYAENSAIKIIMDTAPAKFLELPNGVDTGRFKPRQKNETLLTRHKLNQQDKIILFVGGLDTAHYFKGLDYLLRALVPLNDQRIKALIVGDGDLRVNYKQQATELGIASRVIFVGRVSAGELPYYHSLADVLVLPSIDSSESFGIVLVEAMASGKPVIASSLPGVRQVVDDGVTGLLVRPKDSVALSKALVELLTNRELAGKLGTAGFKKVEEYYDWRVIGAKCEELYAALTTGT